MAGTNYIGTNRLGVGPQGRTIAGAPPIDPVLAFLNDQGAFATLAAEGTPIQPPPTPRTPAQQYDNLLNDDIQSNNNWYTGRRERDDAYLGEMSGIVNGANAADQGALARYHATVDPTLGQIAGIQAPQWQDYNSDPQDVANQRAAYDWSVGAANGSLDRQATLANYQTANYQTAAYQQAQQTMAGYKNADYQGYNASFADVKGYEAALAKLHQYASNPGDVQRQLSGLSDIQRDIVSGGDGQRKILAQIYEDLQKGGDGQRDAISRLKTELDSGGKDQREVLEKYKALSNPEVTAQERYLAEIARRSFEAQDRGSREAVLSDQAARGVRSGSAEIASALGNQERFGQDRTLAELGLQANAVGRSMQALQGWQGSADSLRAAQQNGLAMFTQAQNALRQAQQNGMALAADEENALRQAQQNGLAMYQQAADSIRAMNDQVGLANTGWANQNSQFNAAQTNDARRFTANAYNVNSMFNADAMNQSKQFTANAYNQNSMFNADAYNSNQQFNAEQSNITSRFNADAYNMNQRFNADAYNMNQQFNANAYNANQIANAGYTNQAASDNQNARLQGGVQMGNNANSIRGQNDLVGMFNINGAQTSKRFEAQLAFDKADATARIGQTSFQNDTYTNDMSATRSGALATSKWSIPSDREEKQRVLRKEQSDQMRIQLARDFQASQKPTKILIPGLGA